MLTTIFQTVFSESAMGVWIPWLAGALLSLVGGFVFKGKLDAKNALFLAGLEVATAALTKISANTANTVDDKVAFALQVLNKHFNAAGKTLAPADEAKAKALFLAMHPEGK